MIRTTAISFAFAIALTTFLVGQRTGVPSVTGTATYRYDNPGTKIEGVLLQLRVYGPPGYGETPLKDAKETILVLKLPHAITVKPKPNTGASGTVNLDDADDIREVQLFIPRAQMAIARKLVGRIVTATGTLNESITASQRTKVWLDVTAISPK